MELRERLERKWVFNDSFHFGTTHHRRNTLSGLQLCDEAEGGVIVEENDDGKENCH